MTRPPIPAARRHLIDRLLDALVRVVAALARTADRRLDALGLAPPPLDLPPEVLDDLHAFFAGTVSPTAVTIRRGHVPGIPHPRAFALPGLIYLGTDPGIVGIAGPAGSGVAGVAEPASARGGIPGPVRARATPTLVHELVHIWQGRFLGPRYVVRALGEQIRLGRRAYDWRAALDRRGGLPVEAHAQLVSEAYAARYGPPPFPALSRREEHLRAVEEVLTGLHAGDASTLRGRTV